ncbi:SDR family oxidoreductase [Paraburkholderia sediminicola]|nr:SDR family oxidoreductase [Paraburkholderia sediminicola]
MVGLTRALADELGPHGIIVNVIAPRVIASEAVKHSTFSGQLEVAAKERQAVERVGRPNDLRGLAVFLASDLTSLISTQTIAVDGGITRR